MAHLCGVRHEKALRHAVDMGLAMQLTNIARDIATDAKLGRCYLPLDWCTEFGVSPDELMAEKNRGAVVAMTERMLAEADRLYASGDEGIQYLPWRCALAVSAARHIYAEIGVRVAKKGENAWDERVWVPFSRKLVLLLKGVIQATFSRPMRVSRQH